MAKAACVFAATVPSRAMLKESHDDSTSGLFVSTDGRHLKVGFDDVTIKLGADGKFYSATSAASSLANGCTLNDGGALDAILAFTTQTGSAPTITIPNFAGVSDTFAFLTLPQTFASKTHTSAGSFTQAGAAAITSGTGAIAWNGEITVAGGKNQTFAAAGGGGTTSYLSILGKTSGGIKILPPDAGTSLLTLSCEAQTQACTIKFPDMNVATGQVPGINSDHSVVITAAADCAMTLPATVTLAGNFITGAAVTFNGADAIQFNTAGAFTYGLPAGSGTLALATGAESGTTQSLFVCDNDSALPKIGFSTAGAAVGNFTASLIPAATLTGNRSITFADASGTVMLLDNGGSQTAAGDFVLSGALTITNTVTVTGANDWDFSAGTGAIKLPQGTCTFYGNLANNGNISVDFSASSGTTALGTGTTTLNGQTILNHATTPTLTLQSGKTNTGYIDIKGKTNGTFRLTTADSTAQVLTLSVAAQSGGNATLSIPDLAGAAATIITTTLAQTMTGVKTFTAAPLITIGAAAGVTTLATLTKSVAVGAGAANDGLKLSYVVENDTSTIEVASLQVINTTATLASIDTDLLWSTMLGGAVQPAMTLDASDQSLTLGQNVTDADGVDKLRIYGLTTAKGSLIIQSVANTNNVDVTIKNAASAAARVYTYGDAGADKYIAYTATAAGTVSRADITTDTGIATLNLTDARVWNARVTSLPNAAAADDMGLINGTSKTDPLLLQGIDFKAGTTDEACYFSFTLPENYVDGGTITIRVRAGMNTTVSAGTATVDVNCYTNDDDGTLSADLCETAAQSINNLTAADKDFVITPTGVVAGEQLDIFLTFGGTDGATGTAVIPQINKVQVRYAAKG